MYNADVVTTPPTSWADLFDPQWAGRASLEDLSITAIDIGAFVNGITNPLEMTPDQLETVKNYLIDHRDQFRTFWKGEADIRLTVQVRRGRDLERVPGNGQDPP